MTNLKFTDTTEFRAVQFKWEGTTPHIRCDEGDWKEFLGVFGGPDAEDEYKKAWAAKSGGALVCAGSACSGRPTLYFCDGGQCFKLGCC